MSEISPGVFHAICQTPINGKILTNCEANKTILASWVQEDQMEVPSPAWLQKVLLENPRYQEQLTWTSADVLDPAKRNQIAEQGIAESRKIFSEAARYFKLSDSEANFRQACSVLGNSFNRIQFKQAMDIQALQLIPASAEELEQYRQKQIAEENKILRRVATSSYEIQRQREIAERRRIETRRTTAQERLEYDVVVGFEKECVYGPKSSPLPANWNNQKLDSSFIKKSSKETLKALISRFGSAQVTARLVGLTHASAILDRGDGRGPIEVSYEFQ